MKTKKLHNPKVKVVTLGCSKNLVDSEVIMGQLKAATFEVQHETGDADIVIVNTCGFIENAKQESIDTIFEYIQEKEAGNIQKLIVTGCLSHRYKDELKSEMPEVDEWFGTLELPNLLKSVGVDYKHQLLGERMLTTPKHYAYLKISEGCNRPCSFCAIPLMRGNHVSKPLEMLVQETKDLVKQGIKEIMLIAQDSTYYGLDLYNERKLPELLKQLSKVEALEWLRLHYAYPSQFPEEALDVMRDSPNICNYLDIPVQHHSDNMLKVMRRGISRRRSEELLYRIREKVPGIAIRTTMLVGHPGETDADFETLLNFVKTFKFDRLGVFTYSHEDNTHAGTLVDDVPDEVKQERAEILMQAQLEISDEANSKLLGTVQKVLFDRMEGDFFVGRTEKDSPEVDNEVWVNTKDNYVRMGDFAMVEITSHTPYDLYGKII